MGLIVLFALLLCISDVESMWTLSNVAVKTGGSVTIPCYYASEYTSSNKYWCQGDAWINCRIVAYATTYGQTSVIDDPARNLFTVKMYSVYYSGYYWCAAEQFGPDDMSQVYLTVSQNPGLSVLYSKVWGVIKGSVTIQCFYTAAYRYDKKMWCDAEAWKCYVEGRASRFQNSVVEITDDWRSSFTVQITGLRRSDTGWYWCSAGNLQVPVHLTVTDPVPGLTTKTTTTRRKATKNKLTTTTHRHPEYTTSRLTTTTHHDPTYTSASKDVSGASVTADSGTENVSELERFCVAS